MIKVTDSDLQEQYMDEYRNFVFTLVTPSEEEWSYHRSKMSLFKYDKGDFFIEPGQDASFYGFISKGIFKRYFINNQGIETIHSFDSKGEMISDYPSLIRGEQASLYIECLEDSYVLVSEEGLAKKLRSRHPVWEQAGRLITEIRYLQMADRLYSMGLSKADRYQYFITHYKDIYKHLSQKDIAAYTGMSPSSLSRILKK